VRAIELAHEGVPLNVIERRLGHRNLDLSSAKALTGRRRGGGSLGGWPSGIIRQGLSRST
jgi:hypothetical protein